MRALPALLGVVATTVTVAACSAPGPAVQAGRPPTPVASSEAVGCDQVIEHVGAPGCPPLLGLWNAYAGGFYLRSASGCVPLVFAIAGRATTIRFAIGSGSCGSPT